jgi:hypothetical protein
VRFGSAPSAVLSYIDTYWLLAMGSGDYACLCHFC